MEDVKFIQHMLGFRNKLSEDSRMGSSHISLYFALFFQWNQYWFKNPISVTRDSLREESKIGSSNTYSKCLHDLHNWGYINYQPSYNRYKGSLVHMYRFDTAYDEEASKHHRKKCDSDVQDVRPSNKDNKQKKDNKQGRIATPINEDYDSSGQKIEQFEDGKFPKQNVNTGKKSNPYEAEF